MVYIVTPPHPWKAAASLLEIAQNTQGIITSIADPEEARSDSYGRVLKSFDTIFQFRVVSHVPLPNTRLIMTGEGEFLQKAGYWTPSISCSNAH